MVNKFLSGPIEESVTDDPLVIDIFNSVIHGLLPFNETDELYLVQIDNWFDFKWLGFSGMGMVKSGFPYHNGRFESVKAAFIGGNRMTLPPFSANRVVSQHCFVRSGTTYVEAPLRPPHAPTKQPSGSNIHRRIQDTYGSACLVWYSSNTIANDRASLMICIVRDDKEQRWYASFQRKNAWKLNSTREISKEMFEALVTRGRAARSEPDHWPSLPATGRPRT